MGMTNDGLSYASDDAYWFLFLEQSAEILLQRSCTSMVRRSGPICHSPCSFSQR